MSEYDLGHEESVRSVDRKGTLGPTSIAGDENSSTAVMTCDTLTNYAIQSYECVPGRSEENDLLV